MDFTRDRGGLERSMQRVGVLRLRNDFATRSPCSAQDDRINSWTAPSPGLRSTSYIFCLSRRGRGRCGRLLPRHALPAAPVALLQIPPCVPVPARGAFCAGRIPRVHLLMSLPPEEDACRYRPSHHLISATLHQTRGPHQGRHRHRRRLRSPVCRTLQNLHQVEISPVSS